MSDIATRYMKLVEKRPELVIENLDLETNQYWGDLIPEDAAHALTFTKLVEALPKGAAIVRCGDGYATALVDIRKECLLDLGDDFPSPLEAVLAFWEGQA